MKRCIPILLSMLFLISCSQKEFVKGRDSDKKDNHPILKSQMSDSLFQATQGRRVKRSDRVIKTKIEAFKLAKSAFLKFEDKEYLAGRQYAVYLVNGFWLVKGMLPPGFTGGTLVAVIDSESGEFISTKVWK